MTDVKKNPISQPKKNNRRRGRGGRKGPNTRGDQKKQQAPVAQTNINRTRRPKIQTLPNGDCRITHREYVEDIQAAGGTPSAFTVQGLPINPGQKGTFQWLSRIAANYESYVFESLSFCYETEASTTLGGTLVLAIDYDASDPAPISKQQAMAYRRSTRTAPWAGCRHTSLREDLAKSKTNFVRISGQPPNTDIKTYDIGNLWVISQGVSTANASLGELYVEYTIKLMTPVYESINDLVPAGGSFARGGVSTAANPMGTIPAANPLNFGIALDGASNFTFSLPGQYLVYLSSGGTGITAVALTPDGHSTVLVVDQAIDAGGIFQVSAFEVTVAEPSVVAFTLTATTVTAGIAAIAVAPTGSL